jgi:rhomboid protease GluP
MSPDTRAVVCNSCGKLVSLADRRCQHCGAPLVATGTGEKIKQFLRGKSVTRILFWSNIAMYLLGLALSGSSIFNSNEEFSFLRSLGARFEVQMYLGVLFPQAVVQDHEYWRLLTYAFLHAGILHILFNMMSLRAIGPFLEEMYGATRFSLLYLGSAIAGGLAVLGVHSAALGASGAIFGLMGGGLAFGIRRGGLFGQEIRGQFLQWIIEGVVLTFVVPGISVSGHLGGLAGGFVLGFLLAPQQRRSAASTAEPPFLTISAAILMIAVPVSFVINITKGLLIPTFGSSEFAVHVRGRDVIGTGNWRKLTLGPLGAAGWQMEIPGEYDQVKDPRDGTAAYFYPKGVVMIVAISPFAGGDPESLLQQESNGNKIVEPLASKDGISTIAFVDESRNMQVRMAARRIGDDRVVRVMCTVDLKKGSDDPSPRLVSRAIVSVARE